MFLETDGESFRLSNINLFVVFIELQELLFFVIAVWDQHLSRIIQCFKRFLLLRRGTDMPIPSLLASPREIMSPNCLFLFYISEKIHFDLKKKYIHIFAFICAATHFLFTTSLADPVPVQSSKTPPFLEDERFTVTNMLMRSANPRSDVVI